MLKLLAASGTLVLIAAAIVGIHRSGGTTIGETSTKVVQSAGSTQTATGGNTTDLFRVKPELGVKLKELNLGDSRQVYVYGVIDESNSGPIAQQILALSKDDKPITLLINSPGGSVIDGAQIVSAMEAAKGPVNTVCVQICASMAAMIHQYGTNRLMLDRSLVMFHPATGGVQGEVDKIYSRLGAIKDYIGEMELNVAKRSGTSYDVYKNKSGIEWWLSARNALSSKVADDVVYVRGTGASKLFSGAGDMRNVNKRLPTINDTKFYWISIEAYNLLYGDNHVSVPSEAKR